MSGKSYNLAAQLNSRWRIETTDAGLISPVKNSAPVVPLFAIVTPSIPATIAEQVRSLGTGCGYGFDALCSMLLQLEQGIGHNWSKTEVPAFARRRYLAVSQQRKWQLSRLLH
jgi:hypothetical protein